MTDNIFKKGWKKIVSFFKESKEENLSSTEGCVPFGSGMIVGLQHVLAMFIGNMTPILILISCVPLEGIDKTNLLQNTILIAGIGTLLQLYPVWRFGGRLPIYIGTSFTYIGMMIYVSSTYGYGTMIGALIIGGAIIALVGLFAKYWYKFIKPIVSSAVVLVLGLSLLSVSADYFAGGADTTNEVFKFCSWQSLLVGSITIISCFLYQMLVKGKWKSLSSLVGIVVGYIVSLFMGGIDFSSFSNMKVFSLPTFYSFESIKFDIRAILPIALVYLVATSENIGGTEAICSDGLRRRASEKEISGVVSGIGLTSSVSAIFGCLPVCVFSQNIGIVSSTEIKNRFALLFGALLLIIASLFPPISLALLTIPKPVLGGVLVMILSSITITGMKMVSSLGFTPKNIIIITLSLGVGFGFSLIDGFYSSLGPIVESLLSNPVVMTFIISLILSFAIPDDFEIRNGLK